MKAHEWRWAIREASIDGTAKTVAWALSSRMNGAGECWPSKQQLADDTGYTVRTVDGAVRRLEQAGLIQVRRGGGRGHSNVYKTPQLKRGNGPSKPRSKQQINPASAAGEEVLREEEGISAYAITVDKQMLELARGWLEVHQ